MLKAIQQFFDQFIQPEAETDTVSEHQLQLATAALAFEMMRQDDAIHADEQATLLRLLKSEFSLSDEETDALVELAEQTLEDSVDYHPFTSLINRHCSAEAKIRLIEMLWHIAMADGHIDRYEEHMVRKVADLLYVSHGDFVNARLRIEQKK